MMARSETFQEQANSSPGFQAFLEKKGDEHAFSCLYLIAGIVCLWAAFSHGNEFCTAPDSTVSAAAAKFVPALTAVDTAAPHRALLATKFTATSTDRMAAMKSIAVNGNMLDEVGGAAGNEAAGASEISQLAPSAGSNSTDGDSDSDAGLSMKTAIFIGPKGWVVTWLTVEGFTALGLPLVSIVMLLLRMHENACVSCLLYVVAVFQAIWLIVGCVWAFWGFVPEACRKGDMGDNFAYHTMWWVCAIWLGSMLTISMVICCILICLMGFAGSTRADGNKYQQVNGQGENV